ncbi:hypothetical protein BX661DRAFT_188137 [Kickxella alabastrina]|uniref:uncharacterized protein n=1 Tax=Kickxella alabastrina TaxID=61397 RepID=UPI00221F0264|nr:uncharacterized protein BX661DRAFT_188137 [Kickxella alabastrina]KAI7821598.1 hypothetical protein BX661DRAFT_188137 [Kickxella alabastrina]
MAAAAAAAAAPAGSVGFGDNNYGSVGTGSGPGQRSSVLMATPASVSAASAAASASTASGGLLSGTMGISAADLHEIVQLLTVSSKQHQHYQYQQPSIFGGVSNATTSTTAAAAAMAYNNTNNGFSGSSNWTSPFVSSAFAPDYYCQQQQHQHQNQNQNQYQPLPGAPRILQQLAELQLFTPGAPPEDCVAAFGSDESYGCHCHCHNAAPNYAQTRSAVLVNSQRMLLMDEYHAVRRRYAQALASHQSR